MKKIIPIIITIIIVIIGFIAWTIIYPNYIDKNAKKRIINLSQEIKLTNVGIIPVEENGNNISYQNFGSGVIFKKEENKYYVLTAAHVVEDAKKLLIYTPLTKIEYESLSGVSSINIMKQESYELMYRAEKEYVSDFTDIAIISFETNENLNVIELETTNSSKGDKVITIGNPEGEFFTSYYGYVKSDIKSFKARESKITDKVIEHNSYVMGGSSGGAVLNENMKLVGIITGGTSTPMSNKYISSFMIPISQVKKCIDEWNNSTKISD